MRNLNIIWVIVMACVLNMTPVFGQSEAKKNKIIADSQTAKKEFIKSDPLMKALFDQAYGYVIFPNVGKGGLAIGGAAGNGVVYEHNKRIGMAKLSQLKRMANSSACASPVTMMQRLSRWALPSPAPAPA